MLIVLDTNVLVSSLLKRNSKPAQILDAVLNGKIQLAIDERIFEEYTELLHRPKFNIPIERADAVLRFISFSSLWVEVHQVNYKLDHVDDPGDLPFADVAFCSGAEIIVTGNIKHFGFLRGSNILVLLPDEFLKNYPDIS